MVGQEAILSVGPCPSTGAGPRSWRWPHGVQLRTARTTDFKTPRQCACKDASFDPVGDFVQTNADRCREVIGNRIETWGNVIRKDHIVVSGPRCRASRMSDGAGTPVAMSPSKPTFAHKDITHVSDKIPTDREAVLSVLDALQWPAMAVTLLASWLVASKHESRRHWGFWIFIASNVLWVAWGWHTSSYALIVLQAGLFFMNVRGARENPE